ncbi:hydroxyacid dehydrogenase [Microbacterium gilvum]|uniref:Hydroxyacid dehydrogenase n=1 Tax=Microbacterium gilvum TaxID=1336204 RepID=A0ABP8ZZ36_9MICO
MSRPRVVLAMRSAELADELLEPADRRRLAAVVDVADAVLTDVAAAGADALLAGADLLLTGWGAPAIDDDLLRRAPRLRAVAHAAGTVKRLVTPAAWERGIRFSTAAGANGVPVAEYTLAMILLAGKRVFDSQRFLRAERHLGWVPSGPFGNDGAVVGVVGASRIGRRVLELLRPFDLEVLLADPTVDAVSAAQLGAELVALDDLLDRSAVVSLHAPLLPSTERMIGARELARMADGATLVNTARGRLVDTDALVTELVSGRLRAVLDVTDPEPLPVGHPLFSAPGVELTPHVAGALGNELHRLGAHAVSEIERFVVTGAFADEVHPGALAGIA